MLTATAKVTRIAAAGESHAGAKLVTDSITALLNTSSYVFLLPHCYVCFFDPLQRPFYPLLLLGSPSLEMGGG